MDANQPDTSTRCAQCRTPRPPSARFCPTCGADYLALNAVSVSKTRTLPPRSSPPQDMPAAGSPSSELDMIELGTIGASTPGDTGVSGHEPSPAHTTTGQVSGGTTNTLRLIMTVGAALVAVIIGWSLLSGDATDADTATHGDTTTEAATDEAEPTSPTETAASTLIDKDPDTTNEDDTSQRGTSNEDATSASGIAEGQAATQTADGADEVLNPLVVDLMELDLSGHLVQTSSSGIKILDLSTGELVEMFDEELRNALATTDGVLCCGRPGGPAIGAQSDWTLYPWDGNDVTSITLENGETVRAAVQDPDAGLLVIVGQTRDAILLGGLTNGYAIRVETGERKRVIVHESQPFAIPAVWGSGLGNNLIGGIGDRVYTWRWETEWTELKDGILRSAADTHFVADRCTNPTECTRELFSPTGALLGELPGDLFVFGSNFSTMAPDRKHLATETFTTTGPQILLVDVASGETTPVNVRSQQSPIFSTAATWVGNNHLVVADQLGRYAVVDIRTDESWELPVLRNNQVTLTWLPDGTIPVG